MLPRLVKDPLEKKRRIRSPGHLAWVRQHRCCVPGCMRLPIEAAHVRNSDLTPEHEKGGSAMKPGDNWTISLCGGWAPEAGESHAAEQTRIGEAAFERKYNINMGELALEFAARSPFRKKWEKAA
jgi:hypothetical protein